MGRESHSHHFNSLLDKNNAEEMKKNLKYIRSIYALLLVVFALGGA